MVKRTPPKQFVAEFFEASDFSGPEFENVMFENCTFRGCVFENGRPGVVGLFGCNFTDCRFLGFDFRRIAIGAEGGTFERCLFRECNFTGRHFEYPHFEDCEFAKCKFKGANLNDASFSRCRFIGRLEDVTFNGMHHKRSTGHPPLSRVDFSQALFGDFVTFESCDLSDSIPPVGRSFDQLLYPIYRTRRDVLSTGSHDRIVLDE